jgi:hypothetical protein
LLGNYDSHDQASIKLCRVALVLDMVVTFTYNEIVGVWRNGGFQDRFSAQRLIISLGNEKSYINTYL